jgi:hypothetical protein
MTKKLGFAIAVLACWMGLSGSPAAATQAQAGTCGPDVIPVVLTGEPDSTGYIQPVCSKCKKLTVSRQTTATGETQGVLGLIYFDDAHPTFDGAILLTLQLSDGSERVVTIDDVQLEAGEDARWMIDAGSLSWALVDTVWIEFIPAE